MLHSDILNKIFHINPEPMALSRLADGLYVEVNQAFLKLFGYQREEVVGHTAAELGFWEDAERDSAPLIEQIQRQGYAMDLEVRFLTKTGATVRFHIGAARIEGDGGPFLLIVGRDITELRRGEAALRESEALYRSFIENLPLGVMIAQDGLIRFANPTCCELIGYGQDELIDRPFLPLVAETDRERLAEYHHLRMQGNDAPARYDLRMFRKDGAARHWRVHASTITWEGRRAGLIAFSDVTAQKLAEKRVTDLALHDIGTGLPNRLLLADRTRQAIAEAGRRKIGLALVYVDLDGFKTVNDTFGHMVGDEVLKVVARRLRECTREGDTSARVGGDEFVLLIQDLTDRETAVQVAEKVIAAIHHPITSAAGEHVIGASAGIALFPEHGTSYESLMRRADETMYLAKRAGRNCVRCAVDESDH
jgi:diguanylate cyclase (GGDEF)-like protein/PAS domain S-box-containing protein